MLSEPPEGQEKYQNLFRFINEECGIRIKHDEAPLYEDRLRELMDETDCESFDQLCEKGTIDKENHIRDKIIDSLTPNETLWFRNPELWDILGNALLCKKNNDPNKPVKVWSAGCSSGQETYSFAMMLDKLQNEGQKINPTSYKILGTDISPSLLFMAVSGRYHQPLMEKGLERTDIEEYFKKDEDSPVWSISDDIKANISFKRQNLLEDFRSYGKFDYILCRNVSYYFSDQFQDNFFKRISGSLADNGVLILGRTESLPEGNSVFEKRDEGELTYYVKSAK